MKPQPLLKVSDKTRIATKSDGTKLPVLDGKWSVIIQPNKNDIEKGIPGDPQNCMYCVCCRRMLECELVFVTRTRAYVELKGAKGRPELRRFVLKNPAQMQVKDFDRDKYVTPEAVIFAKPEGKESLNGIRARYQNDKLQPKPKRAFIKGKGPKKKVERPHEIDSFHTLRASGTGMFQFPRKQESKV